MCSIDGLEQKDEALWLGGSCHINYKFKKPDLHTQPQPQESCAQSFELCQQFPLLDQLETCNPAGPPKCLPVVEVPTMLSANLWYPAEPGGLAQAAGEAAFPKCPPLGGQPSK